MISAGEAVVLFGITACVILLFFVALKRMRRLKQEEEPGKVESEPSRDEPAAPKSKRGRGKKVQHKASARSQLRQWEKPPIKETPEPEVPIVVEEAVVPATFVDGLQKTRREGFMAKIRRVLNKDLAPDILDEMEEVLLTADIGVKTATSMLNNVREKMSRSELTSAEGVVEALREEASKILEPASQWEAKESAHPTVVLMIGVNGSGKTTLLRMLMGQVEPDSGSIEKPDYATIGYLPQDGISAKGSTLAEEAGKAFADALALRERLDEAEVRLGEMEPDVEEFYDLIDLMGAWEEQLAAYEPEKMKSRIEKVLTGMGFPLSDMDRDIGEFSGGWQMRIALSKLLLQAPSLLILDEPTNHMDIVSQHWLEQYLKRYQGALIVISHDRARILMVAARS